MGLPDTPEAFGQVRQALRGYDIEVAGGPPSRLWPVDSPAFALMHQTWVSELRQPEAEVPQQRIYRRDVDKLCARQLADARLRATPAPIEGDLRRSLSRNRTLLDRPRKVHEHDEQVNDGQTSLAGLVACGVCSGVSIGGCSLRSFRDTGRAYENA